MKLTFLTVVWFLISMAGCATTEPRTSSQWESTGGPYAQNVTALLVDERNPGRLLAGLSNGEIFGTTDNGANWIRVSTIKPKGVIYGFVQDPESWERVYVRSESGAFVSSTRGKDWKRLPLEPGGTSPLAVHAFAIDPWRPNVIYAGLKGKGLNKSTDAGNTWTSINTGVDARLAQSEPAEITIDVERPDLVYAAVPGLGLLKSTDAGATWGKLSEDYTATSTNVTHIILKDRASQVIVYGTSTGNMFRSSDGGKSWSPTRNGLEMDGITSLTSLPTNGDMLFAGTEHGILVSSDFGSSWLSAPGDLPKLGTVVATAMKGSNSSIYAFGSGIGLQSSSDAGVSWHRADTKLGGSTVTFLATEENTSRLYAAVHNTLLFYNEQTGLWTPASTGISGGEITAITFDHESPDIFYVSTTTGAFKTMDAGKTWQSTARSIRMNPDFLDFHPWIKTRMFASGDQGLFVSTDKGSTWSQTRPAGSTRFRVRSLTYAPTNAGVIYGASQNSGVILSTNGGISWEAIRYGLSSNDIVALTLDDKDPSTCYAWTEKGEGYRTTNKGVEWNRYAPPWKQSDTVRIAFDRSKPSSVVALVNGHEVYYSSTGGGTWVPILDWDIQAEVVSVLWDSRAAVFYAGTKENGVFRIGIGKILRKTFGD